MLADYERVGVVVRTATTTIWKGVDPALNREVALKHLTGRDAADAARREAAVLSGLRHPNVVSVYDVFDDDGTWLVEQWVSGAPLSAVLRRTKKLQALDALALVHGALTGLAHAHDRDVVHGDISPNNVLIDPAGMPMLVDFGLAVSPGQTSLGGTPGYAAPEASAGGTVDKRSDVYSSCVVLAELLTGTRLFPGNALAVTEAQSAAPALPGVEPAVASVLTAGLDSGPRHRPADAGELLARLEEAAERTYGKGWLAAAGLGAIGSTAATVGAGVTLSGGAAAVGGTAAASSVAGSAAVTTASTVGRGKLFAAAGVGTVAVGAIAAFLLLRPETPQPTVVAETTSTTTTTTPPPVALPPPPPPVPQGPIFAGTYAVTASSSAATLNSVLIVSSDCPMCDATGTWNGTAHTFTWNGVGWAETEDTGGCGPRTTLFIPTGDVNGVVQNATLQWSYLNPAICGSVGVGGTATRTG